MVWGAGVFKKYDQQQSYIMPYSLEDFVSKDSVARTVDDVVEGIDMSCFNERYSRLGQRAYDPRMMLKVLFYSYFQGMTSSRSIASMILHDTEYMFLAGMQKPDFRTVCRFRTVHKEDLAVAFRQIVSVCMDLGMIGLGNVSFDGTKIKASASGKRTKNLDGVDKRIKKLLEESELVDREEDELYGEGSPYKMPVVLRDPAKRKELIWEKLRKLEEEKKRIKEEHGKEGVSAEEQGKKNVNLTDPDARLMRTRQGTRPAYNGQLAVDGRDQVIVAASLVMDVNDVQQLEPMLMEVEENLGRKPWVVTADSGYSSHDNLLLLKKEKILGLVPDNMYRTEEYGKTGLYPKTMFKHDPEKDVMVCPAGKELAHHGSSMFKGRKLEHYKGKECMDCADRLKCTRSRDGRKITRNELDYLYVEMRRKLDSRIGNDIYKERMSTVEPVFGNIKENMSFKQFRLRGLTKTNMEFLLVCGMHNIQKIHIHLKKLGKTLKQAFKEQTTRQLKPLIYY